MLLLRKKINKITNDNVWYEDKSSYGKIWKLYPDYHPLYYTPSQKGWCISFDYKDSLIDDGCIVMEE